jgi:hypothetical protein
MGQNEHTWLIGIAAATMQVGPCRLDIKHSNRCKGHITFGNQNMPHSVTPEVAMDWCDWCPRLWDDLVLCPI